MSKIWVADTEPSERFPLYSRGNVGEVFPHAMTALTGTLIGDAVGRAQLQMVSETGALGRRERVGAIGTGVFGGYLYVNHSMMRLFGRRTLGLSVDDIDEQVTGGVADLPPYRAAPGDRNLLASVRLAVLLDLALAGARPGVARRGPERGASLAGDHARPRGGRRRDAAGVARHVPAAADRQHGPPAARQLRGRRAPRGFIDRILDDPARRRARQSDRRRDRQRRLGANRPAAVAAVPARRHRCRHLGTLRRRARRHRRALRGTPRWSRRWQSSCATSGIAATTSTSWRRPRGRWTRRRSTPPSTGCATHPTNATRTRPPSARRGRRRGGAGRSTRHRASRHAPAHAPFAALARTGGIARERAKDIFVLENHGARQVLHELARRAADRGGPAGGPLGRSASRQTSWPSSSPGPRVRGGDRRAARPLPVPRRARPAAVVRGHDSDRQPRGRCERRSAQRRLRRGPS